MNSIYGHWRNYQEAVAAFFRAQGCNADVEARVQGARAIHAIDVFVTFHQHGFDCRWIVECKLRKDPVKKESVQALKSIIEDVGADRGIIFSESGFQAGAREAAKHTNVLLVNSLEEFQRTAGLNNKRIAFVVRNSDQPGAPPVHAFPNGDQPHDLLFSNGRLFVANWQTGNIAVVDPIARSIHGFIDLDKYETVSPISNERLISQYPPGAMAYADGKLFVGQVFSEFLVVIDVETHSIVRRIPIPGGGEGAIASSGDGSLIFFASNRNSQLFIIDSATYEVSVIDYPAGGRGSLCVLPHPTLPLLYIGIQRGGLLDGKSFFGGNCFLATYDLSASRYVGNLYLAEVMDGRSDDATPICLTYDPEDDDLFVGMFQSERGICKVDRYGREIKMNFRFEPNTYNKHFRWVDPISQALYRNKLLSINRNNRELVTLDKRSGEIENSAFLGDAPNGPRTVVVVNDIAVISYPNREGLVFHNLGAV